MSDEIAVEPASAPAPRRWAGPAVAAALGLLVGAGGVGAAWSVSGSSSSNKAAAGAPASFDLHGSLTLTNAVSLDNNHTMCTGYGGFSDIVQGAAVTVYDAAGAVVGTGSLGAGQFASTDSAAPCRFDIAVPGIADRSAFYQVEVSHRGKLTVSAADAKGGLFASSLG